MSKKKAYFARCITDYNTDHDKYCIEDIEGLGFEIVDPNEFFTQEEYDKRGMEMFFERIEKCDVFFFKGLPDRKVTAGVFKEMLHALGHNLPIFEIPFNVAERTMSVDETRQHLKEKGVR